MKDIKDLLLCVQQQEEEKIDYKIEKDIIHIMNKKFKIEGGAKNAY